jgi:hypothetical protein
MQRVLRNRSFSQHTKQLFWRGIRRTGEHSALSTQHRGNRRQPTALHRNQICDLLPQPNQLQETTNKYPVPRYSTESEQ